MVSSDLWVGPLPRTKIFFLLSKCTEEPLSTLKVTTFLPHSPFDYKQFERVSNPIM